MQARVRSSKGFILEYIVTPITILNVRATDHPLLLVRNAFATGKTLLFPISIGLLSVSSIVGFVLLGRVEGINSDLAAMKNDLAATKQRMTRAEKTFGDVTTLKEQLLSNRTRIECRPSRSTLTLPDLERDLVRQFIKVPPPPPGAQPRIQIGESLPDGILSPFPDQLIEKLPKLRGARFAVDRNGESLSWERGSNYVEVIVPLTDFLLRERTSGGIGIEGSHLALVYGEIVLGDLSLRDGRA